MLRFRNRGRLNPYQEIQPELNGNRSDNAALSLLLNSPSPLYESLGWDLKGATPRMLTERARMIETANPRVHEVISKAELSQAVRAVQCATTVASIYAYMAQPDTGGGAMQMDELLHNPAQLSQHGADYFLYRDDLIVRGYKLVSFEERLAHDEGFAKLVSETQYDAEAAYNIALADACRACAQDALNYLSTADRVYRATEHVPETPRAEIGDVFAAKLEALKARRGAARSLERSGRLSPRSSPAALSQAHHGDAANTADASSRSTAKRAS